MLDRKPERGDLVQLVSGGPAIAVHTCTWLENSKIVYAIWMDFNGSVHNAEFRPEVLKFYIVDTDFDEVDEAYGEDRVQDLLEANNRYLDRARRAEAALEHIARYNYDHISRDSTSLDMLQTIFDLMNYASAAKAGLFDPRDFRVGEQPLNIDVEVIAIRPELLKDLKG